MSVTIVSWNVNGLRACAGKGFLTWLAQTPAAIVALQEVRSPPEKLPPEVRQPDGWHTHIVAAERAGYSGVGLYARQPWQTIDTSLGVAEFDVEGRIQIARFGALTVVNGYFPNGNGQNRDNSRIPYKLAFYQRLFDQLQPAFARGEPIVVLGDWNTAPEEIDIARPRENRETSGFRPEERAEVRRWLAAGWVDAFRQIHPDRAHAYSWWSQRFGVRAKNIGWRIDLTLISPGALPYLEGAEIHADTQGSDHCPISVTFADGVLGG